MDIYDRIEKEMKRAGEKPADLSRATGLKSGLLTQWKQRKQIPSRDKLMLVANHYGCTVDYLLTGGISTKQKPPAEAEGEGIINEIMEKVKRFPPEAQEEVLRFVQFRSQNPESGEE